MAGVNGVKGGTSYLLTVKQSPGRDAGEGEPISPGVCFKGRGGRGGKGFSRLRSGAYPRLSHLFFNTITIT